MQYNIVAPSVEWLKYLIDWNLILVIIGGCSIIALAIFLERLIYLNRAEIDTGSFLIQLKKSIENHNIVEGITLCEQTRGPVANIIKAGLMRHDQNKKQIESIMEASGMLETSKLEKNAKILSIIAHITPLIGLLGTVLGFIQAFSEMRQSGLMDISTSRIGGAMEYALVTTAAGLVVAIPCVVAYNYIISRIEHLVLQMQTTATDVVNLIISDNKYEV